MLPRIAYFLVYSLVFASGGKVTKKRVYGNREKNDFVMSFSPGYMFFSLVYSCFSTGQRDWVGIIGIEIIQGILCAKIWWRIASVFRKDVVCIPMVVIFDTSQ